MLNNQQVANGTLLGKITEAGTMTGFVICFVSVRAGEIFSVAQQTSAVPRSDGVIQSYQSQSSSSSTQTDSRVTK